MHPISLFVSTNVIILFHEMPSADWFRKVLKIINNVYRFISIEEVESFFYEGKDFNNCCHVCFDDGDKTFYEKAFPVLKEMNIPATLFISPKIITERSNYWFQELDYLRRRLGDTLIKKAVCETLHSDYSEMQKYTTDAIFKCLRLKDILKTICTIKEKHGISIDKDYNITKAELCELFNSGIIKIGAHTMNHPILSNESDEDANMEICKSVEGLSSILGARIKYFAYPNGTSGLDYGARERLILQENSIRLAFATDESFFGRKIDPLGMPRFTCSGLKEEKTMRLLARIFLLPVWDLLRYITKFRQEITETKERKEIKKLSLI